MGVGGPGGQYRINLVWTSHGGQVLATLGQIQSGMRQVGGAGVQHGRNLGYFNRQMMALGTTMRYFFAGGAIFGSMTAFRQFAEFEGRLGNLAALEPQITGMLNRLGQGFLQSSTLTATPVTELEDSARNILSTMQLTQAQMREHLGPGGWPEMFSMGARVAESDAYAFGNAVMGMNNAFQRELGDMENTAGQFFTVIQRSAGMTGDEWAKFSGRVVAGAGQAGASLEEMNALMILMTRQGATAATNARHLAQMLMQIRNPTNESIPFWRDIGLSPEALRTMPFEKILARLVDEVRRRGGLRAPKGRMSEEAVLGVEELGDEATLEQLGIRGGGGGLLMDLFGRIEGRRAAGVVISEIIAGRRPGRPSYEELLGELQDVEQQTKTLDEAFARWLDRNRIQQAGVALRNMMIDAFTPFRGQIKGIAEFVTENADPRWVQGAALAALGLGGARVARGGIRGAAGMLRWARGLGAAGIAVNQMGQAPPSGSFANPFWVIIHPLSNVPGLAALGMPGRGGPGGGVAPPGSGGWRSAALRGTIAGIPAAIAADQVMQRTGLDDWEPGNNQAWWNRPIPRPGEIWNRIRGRGRHRGFPSVFDSLDRIPQGQGSGLFNEVIAASRSVISGQRARDESRMWIGIDISDEARKLLRVNVRQEGGERNRVHVPRGHNAWQGGATPQFRGADTVNRR